MYQNVGGEYLFVNQSVHTLCANDEELHSASAPTRMVLLFSFLSACAQSQTLLLYSRNLYPTRLLHTTQVNKNTNADRCDPDPQQA